MASSATIRKPFIEHVHELRRRLVWCVLAIGAGGFFGYSIHQSLLNLVQQPLNQTLYFTSPTGGFNFVFKLCLVFGFLVASPIIAYQIIRFLSPLINKVRKSTIVNYLLWSVNLAYAGLLFAYFVSLPAALHFLTKFGGENVESLITANEYFNFALAYIGGFALLFQLPLVILFINRIKPLKPIQMLKAQRWIILISFIVAAILTPTPDPINQIIMAVPVVLLYQFSIGMVWLLNRGRKTDILDNFKVTEHAMYEVLHEEVETIEAAVKELPKTVEKAIDSLQPVVRHPARATRKAFDIIAPSQVSQNRLVQ